MSLSEDLGQYPQAYRRGGAVIVEIAEPASQAVLNMSVPRLLCREQRTATFRAKAYAAGIRTVNDLISTPAEELFRRVPTSPANQVRIRDALRAFGLELR